MRDTRCNKKNDAAREARVGASRDGAEAAGSTARLAPQYADSVVTDGMHDSSECFVGFNSWMERQTLVLQGSRLFTEHAPQGVLGVESGDQAAGTCVQRLRLLHPAALRQAEGAVSKLEGDHRMLRAEDALLDLQRRAVEGPRLLASAAPRRCRARSLDHRVLSLPSVPAERATPSTARRDCRARP